MFGLMTTAQLNATASNNLRRQVYHEYPNAAMILMGLTSLMPDRDHTDKQSFGWNEDRLIHNRSITASANAAGPFTDNAQAAGAVGTDLTAAGWGQASGTTIRVKVQDASVFRVRDVVWIKDVPGTASSFKDVRGVVDAVWTSPNTIDVRLIETVADVLNNTTANGIYVDVIGTASVEGGYSKKGGYVFPVEVYNNTQIFRTVVGPFTRNALKMGQKFDQTGVYKEAAKQAHIRHMTAMEKAMFWGVKGSQTVTDGDDGESKTEKTMGGLLWYMRQWELGTTGNGADVTRRPNGADITAQAWNYSDDKRILKFGGTQISGSQMLDIIQRAFISCSDNGWEKLFVMGNGLMGVFNKFFDANSIKVVKLGAEDDTYGMQVVKWETVFGTLILKTHPLFTSNPMYTYSGFITDVGSLGYVPFQDADTELLANRQARDFDGRKDEWLTEFGGEFAYPERHLYIENLRGILP